MSKNGTESDSRWVPPTPQNLAPKRRHSEKRVLPLNLLSRISGQEGDHEQENNESLCDSVAIQESAVGKNLNKNISASGDANVGFYDSKKLGYSCEDLLKNGGSQCASNCPNLRQHFSDCVVAPSDSALTTDISERGSADVEKERVFAGDGNNEVLFNEEGNDFIGSQTCVSLDNEEKEEKHQNDGCSCSGEKSDISEFNFVVSQSSVCDVERNSADVANYIVLDPKNIDALFKEGRNDFNGLQTCISHDDQEKEGKCQNDGCYNLSQKGFASESSPFLEHNAKKRRGSSLDERRPRKRAKVKKIRPKVAFEGRTRNTPKRTPKTVRPKTVSVKNPSETRQKRKYVRKITSEKKGKKGKKSAGGDHDNAMIMDKNLNHCSAIVSPSAASSTKSRTITDSNGCQYNLQGRLRDLRIDPLINYKGTENFPLEYRGKKSTENAGGDVDNAMIMDKNLNHCSTITSATAVFSTITNSTGCQYNLRGRQRDQTIDSLIKYNFPFEYRKKRMKRRKKLHSFFSFLPSRYVTKKKKKKKNFPCFFSLWPFGRVTKRRSKLPTRKVELASCTVIPEGDQMLNAGLEQTELKSELDYSKSVTKKRSKRPTRKVELASCAVIPDGDQMLNVGLERTELNSELAHCTLISKGDQVLDVTIDQLSREIDFDIDYLYCKESLIAPMGQTLNDDMEDFLPAVHELVHEEMTGHFPEKLLLFEDASKEIFSIELVNFLGRAVATEDKAETICGLNEENRELMDFLGRAVACEAETHYRTNEENREVMDFIGRAVASEDKAETIYRIMEENREVNSAKCCLQLGMGPAGGASWSCEANMMGNECSQVILKSTGMKPVCHEPKTPVKINEKNALVPRKGSRKKLPDISHNGAIVPVSDKRKFLPKVLLDEESLRMWELTVRTENGLGSEEDYKEDAKLKEDIKVFQGRIESFTSKMHLVLGDRRFKEWKGSVVDSVVGVFLTQNVSDTLSSSAYMSLAAKYPVQSSSNQGELDVDEDLKNMHIHGSQYYVTMPEAELDFESKNKLVNPMDAYIEDLSMSNPYTSDSQRDDNSGILEESATVINTCRCCTKNLYKDENVLDIGTRQPDNGKERTSPMGKKKGDKNKNEEKLDWDSFRKRYERPRTKDQRDSVDWEAVRSAEHCEVASTIKSRGQHTILAEKIQEFLNRIRELHSSIDLEWLRYAPPHIAKKYLLEINGVGLKSTECIRLLELQHIAFPVDTNVGRIAVRLGWVPLQTLPGNLELHLLSDYPPMDEIQKYLWPRLRKLGQRRLYELHYHMITFGKVFCTKRNPNCNACPMRAECRHFASSFASANFRLPGPSNEGKGRSEVHCLIVGSPDMHRNSAAFTNPTSVSLLEPNTVSLSDSKINYCQPIVEEPLSPPPCEQDIEDFVNYDNAGCNDEEIPTIKLSNGDFNANVQSFLDKFHNSVDNNISRAIVPVSVEAASIPARKQKQVTRLRTEHQVYEIPDNHELLEGLDKREADDPVPYLLAIWTPGETAYSCGLPTKKCNTQGSVQLCDDSTCLYCETIREERADIVRGTILIPCRTALKANFPLNGTYFQVNEVFADHETSYKPINVPRRLIWNFRRRTVLVGTSTSSIFNGMLSIKEIQEYFWRGYVCVRGIDRKTRGPKPLSKRFHCPPSKMEKTKKKVNDEKNH